MDTVLSIGEWWQWTLKCLAIISNLVNDSGLEYVGLILIFNDGDLNISPMVKQCVDAKHHTLIFYIILTLARNTFIIMMSHIWSCE